LSEGPSTARDLGLANKAGMAVTGHKVESVYLDYDRRSKRTSTRLAVEAVHAAHRLHRDSTFLEGDPAQLLGSGPTPPLKRNAARSSRSTHRQ
jgi:hypothetical protein